MASSTTQLERISTLVEKEALWVEAKKAQLAPSD